MVSPAFDANGLIPAIAQDRLTGQIRMVAWMNAEALRVTIETGRATFFSRSRGRLWVKGETSGHHLTVRSVHADCDADTLLLLVDPVGPSCHTGRPTCFFRLAGPDGAFRDVEREAGAFLWELEAEIGTRMGASAAGSYTKSLLDGGPGKVADKIREEAGELGAAIEGESRERVESEAADLLYHVLVGLRLRDVPLRRVIEVLAARAGTSGHAEKAGRNNK